ncbi:MAG: YicC/YloC family endoribonuclease [Chlamydiota bacterium]|nr:YicC/YloC family endoribonuclease [Chlamydiota bacterium]
MFRSMTAYVYKTFATSFGLLTIEIQSLNRKHLDILTSLQAELSRYENEVRKKIGSKIHRGKVLVKIYLKTQGKSTLNISPNLELARQLKASFKQIADELDITCSDDALMKYISSQEGVLDCEDLLGDNEEFHQELMLNLSSALDDFIEMKVLEGGHLHEDISGRVDVLENLIKVVANKSHDATNKFRDKLRERIEELVPGSTENDERILREVCVYAERIDTTEEITRFQSHIAQFRKYIDPNVLSIGKKLEFLLQEMLREVNTIGSKTEDLEVKHFVVDMKSELDKIREQLQNIE